MSAARAGRPGLALLALGLLLALGSLVLAPAPAAAASPAPRVELSDLEDEVMCPICGTLLGLAESPQAQRQRVLIRGMIEEGHDKEQIKEVLVAQYGDEVLALPDSSGFDLSAYLVPALGFLIAALALGAGVVRWRRAGRDATPAAAPSSGPGDEDSERLREDLGRYDF